MKTNGKKKTTEEIDNPDSGDKLKEGARIIESDDNSNNHKEEHIPREKVCGNMSCHTLVGRPAARLETMALVKQPYTLV